MNLEAIILAAIPGALALMAVLIQANKDKNRPAVDMTEAAQNLIEPYRVEVKELRERVETLEDEFNKLLRGAWTLHAQLKSNHINPEYTPPHALHEPLEDQRKSVSAFKR